MKGRRADGMLSARECLPGSREAKRREDHSPLLSLRSRTYKLTCSPSVFRLRTLSQTEQGVRFGCLSTRLQSTLT